MTDIIIMSSSKSISSSSSSEFEGNVKATSVAGSRGTPCETFYHYHASCDASVFGRKYCRGLQSAYFAHCVNNEDPLASSSEPTKSILSPFAVSRRRTPTFLQTPSSDRNLANTTACMKSQLLSYVSNCTNQGNSQAYCRNLQSVYHSECVAK